MIDNLFALLIVLIALFHTNFARLPLAVALNIGMFTVMTRIIESRFNVTLTPGYEIYYIATGAYFLIMAFCFFFVRNHFFKLISLGLLLQSFVSALMLFDDGFYMWHEFVNDKILVVNCILVWASGMGVTCKQNQ